LYRTVVQFFEFERLKKLKLSASCPGYFTPGERDPNTHWIGGWMDPRVSLTDVEKRKFQPVPSHYTNYAILGPKFERVIT
jgi:hypothetical protein